MKFTTIEIIVIGLQQAILRYDARGGAFSSYFYHIGNLMIVIGGIVGLIAAIKIYNNWQIGKGNVFHSVTNLFLGSLALLTIGGIIKAMFLL